eukprot:scaffold2533_cov137-Cylindrotheca_fusiformis.AAC.4
MNLQHQASHHLHHSHFISLQPAGVIGDMTDATAAPEFCFLQVSIAGQVQPKPIVVQLRHQNCPKTCQNFIALCNSSKETTSVKRPFPTYRGTLFHRVIENFMVQGGDFEKFDGTGGFSPLFQVFEDEDLKGKHDQAGIVSMANSGRNTNRSQFFVSHVERWEITLKATPHLDGKHVAFGKVVSGMESVYAMVSVEREGDRPVSMQRILISDCGIGQGKSLSSSSSEDEKEKEQTVKQPLSKEHRKRKRHSSIKRKHRRHDKDKQEDDNSLSEDDKDRRRRQRHRHHRESSKKRRTKDYSSSSDDSSTGHGRKHRHRKHDTSRRSKKR